MKPNKDADNLDNSRDRMLVAALKRSGFPFQTRIAYEIGARSNVGWHVLESEFPWRDPYGEDRFLDLIAQGGPFVLLIECKKAQERAMIFLCPAEHLSPQPTTMFSCYRMERALGSADWEISWTDGPFEPASLMSDFCVTTDKDSKEQRQLEKDARLLLLAAQAFVEAHRGHKGSIAPLSFIVPAIVTNARLYAFRYEPTEVDLDAGSFASVDTQNRPVVDT